MKKVSWWTPEILAMRGHGRRSKSSMPTQKNWDHGREIRRSGSAFGSMWMENGPWRQLKAGHYSEEASTSCFKKEAFQHPWERTGLCLKPPLFWNLCSGWIPFYATRCLLIFHDHSRFISDLPTADLPRGTPLRLCFSKKRALLVRLSHRGLEVP